MDAQRLKPPPSALRGQRAMPVEIVVSLVGESAPSYSEQVPYFGPRIRIDVAVPDGARRRDVKGPEQSLHDIAGGTAPGSIDHHQRGGNPPPGHGLGPDFLQDAVHHGDVEWIDIQNGVQMRRAIRMPLDHLRDSRISNFLKISNVYPNIMDTVPFQLWRVEYCELAEWSMASDGKPVSILHGNKMCASRSLDHTHAKYHDPFFL